MRRILTILIERENDTLPPNFLGGFGGIGGMFHLYPTREKIRKYIKEGGGKCPNAILGPAKTSPLTPQSPQVFFPILVVHQLPPGTFFIGHIDRQFHVADPRIFG